MAAILSSMIHACTRLQILLNLYSDSGIKNNVSLGFCGVLLHFLGHTECQCALKYQFSIDEVSLKYQRDISEMSVSYWPTTSKLLANSCLFVSVLLSSLLYWQIIERETSELENLRLEKSAVKSQIDEKVVYKIMI